MKKETVMYTGGEGEGEGVPEEATVIDDTGTVSPGGAVADLGGGGGEAGGAVSGREVVSTLEHGIDRVLSSSFLSRGKVLALVGNLNSEIIQSCVEILIESGQIRGVVLAATFVEQKNLRVS
ncbi:hypothetical protein LR48_Vigan09g143700 [Vigna angularis]|uniref:Uncharacterized protein n=1 Tax=Phaseolus angularis TaxID=3914 RepID=A0A0L9VCP0_PHAAN|nr:hypothetical protein LR48_Vigan09g143700 [Vigna angularis]